MTLVLESVERSVLFMKGLSSDKNGTMNWRNGDGGNWWDAIKRYNGGGVKDYDDQVKKKYDSIIQADQTNY